jgi:tRNA-Thr(GGU) m(6)t(6)A37 methyltransferase TsaA
MTGTIEVVERGRRIAFSFEDVLRYHGPGSPGGAAHAFKVLERALPLLDPGRPCERREIVVETAFGGPGARDAFELVTRAVSGNRFRVDPALARPERGRALERFVFRLGYRERRVTLALREGLVSDEFIDLARTEQRTVDQERRLDALKLDMAERVMARAAAEVYDVEEPGAEIRGPHPRIELPPIGTVESPLTDRASAPKQGHEGSPEAWLVFEPSVAEGLDGIRPGDEVLVLTWLDRAHRDVLRVHPRGDVANALQGVFNTRSPDRPNPIGLHQVEVVAVDGNRLLVRNLEALDGTPIVDVKPVLGPRRRPGRRLGQ